MVQREAVVRPMRAGDLDAIVAIDRAITGLDRSGYYRRRLQMLDDPDMVNMCLVAEVEGVVAGFVMGDLFTGEYGLPEATAAVDTMGVHPSFQDRGLATQLFAQFRANVRVMDVRVVYALVEWGDRDLVKFLKKEGFVPSNRLNLELAL